ncbi:MAG: hypothetical protein NTV22_12845 [bacterium]|nr:hypothetical protein [bacterium]
MKTLLRTFVFVAGLLLTVPAGAATLAWAVVLGTSSPPITVTVDQLIADGSGGCVIVWNAYDGGTLHTKVYTMRLDKKGAVVWRVTTINTHDVQLGMVDKKNAVASLTPEVGNKSVLVIDKKGGITALGLDPGADMFCDMNSEDGPTGDKKGFFVAVTRPTGELVLQRFSYK